MDLSHAAWYFNELEEKVARVRALSDKNYIGDNASALLQMLDDLIIERGAESDRPTEN